MAAALTACQGKALPGKSATSQEATSPLAPGQASAITTLIYGSNDYTRINPAMDEHGEINILLFNGLTAHDGDNQRSEERRVGTEC